MAYTGRKEKNYIWIPKPKTDLREYRLNLKLCKEVQEKEGYFNDKKVGELAVKEGYIYDGKLEPDKYIEKYKENITSMKSYVSNIRMFIRIARFLGWIKYIPEKSGQYILTEKGEALTNFKGVFPDSRGGLDEKNIVLKSFANYSYYSVNDVPNYRDKQFRCRPFLDMLFFIHKFGFCHNFELVVTSFTLKDDRKEDLINEKLEILRLLRDNEINISEAFQKNDLNPNDESTVNNVYDGPKVLLSFARSLDLAEDKYIGNVDNSEEIKKYYKDSYQGSPHINPPRKIHHLTEEGVEFVNKNMDLKKIWFDEL